MVDKALRTPMLRGTLIRWGVEYGVEAEAVAVGEGQG